MPNLDNILGETMMFTANSSAVGNHLGRDAPISAPVPSPKMTKDPALRMTNPVWSWEHDPARPNVVKNVQSKVRGMGMNYGHPMPVARSVSVDEVQIKLPGRDAIFLPLDKKFVLRKYKLDSGRMPAAASGLWQLEAEIDQSYMVVYAYDFTTTTPNPLTEEQVTKLGNAFMPQKGQSAPPAEVNVGEQLRVWAAPLRLIVCFSLTCCKERPDYTPGPKFVGMNRLYPHLMVMASQPLDRVSAVISVERPAKTMHSGKLPPNPGTGEQDEMLDTLRPMFFTDSNKAVAPAPFGLAPVWSNIFDYYSTNPLVEGVKSVVMVDPSKTTTRVGTGGIEKLNPTGYRAESVTKVARQGEFDNLHIAPPMRAPERIVKAAGWHLDDIAMAPFCWHDCFHFHTRWGATWSDKQALGFDESYNPYKVAGAPMVPHDQKVTVSLIGAAGFAYEGVAERLTGTLPSATWQVFFHHGMGYANDIWDESLFAAGMAGIEMFSMGEKNWSPTTASNSVSLFYWRLRWGGLASAQERIRLTGASALERLRKL